ncbi:ornithine cyclodeaminase family protein [Natronolimnohabitans innermongolicus]|uniref:Ornithine cyclodeaminase n=1 Tax=Natronolimnohabitans innermongolicus JCM 12255 TaxID=1227499 RepID=L9WYG8_9EURY|nr:ornithine cyclodeaminase family protein [Natronolimnohabitans innermongolicus]ELY54494.1 ornithine cyclodeaminase [Natronolimnohabitans innermongolicus JCM 12255]
MPGFPILTDADIYSQFEYAQVVDAMREAFAERAAGTLEAPPRWSLEAGDGDLVFTAGAAAGPANVAGFRVYDTHGAGEDHTQLVAVFDATTGAFEGLLTGNAVGRLRTGAIGGVAIDALARDDCETLGVIGSGPQARAQVGAACAVRAFDEVLVYSPTAESRESFAETAGGEVEPPVRAVDDPEPVVREADALVCATNSEEPVFDPDWLEADTHVTTIGPRFTDAHELPLEVVDRADVIATDSIPQVDAYDREYLVNGEDYERMVGLADALEEPALGRTSADETTLFCSVGLAGTEVVLGKRFLEQFA